MSNIENKETKTVKLESDFEKVVPHHKDYLSQFRHLAGMHACDVLDVFLEERKQNDCDYRR